MKHDLEEERRAIEERIARLQARGERIDAHRSIAAKEVLADPVDRAQLLENDEVVTALGESVDHDLAALDAALARIDAGTYGTCTSCHKPIARERLAILPATPFCGACAKSTTR